MTDTGHPYRASNGITPGRLISFSDGIFSIAMTLLVLGIAVPQETPIEDVSQSVESLWPQLFAFFLSFAVLGLFWLVHHRVFALIDRVDSQLLVLNLVLLALVSLLPFPTALLGEHGEARISTVAYALNVGLLSFAVAFTARHAELAGLSIEVPEEERTDWFVRWVPGSVFLVSVPIAFVDPTWAQLSWLALVPLNIVVHRVRRRQQEQEQAPTDAEL